MFALTPFRGQFAALRPSLNGWFGSLPMRCRTHAAMRLETRYGNQPATIEYVRPDSD